jgi:hypothetical protein
MRLPRVLCDTAPVYPMATHEVSLLLALLGLTTATAPQRAPFQARPLIGDDGWNVPPSFSARLEDGRIWSDLLKARRRRVS